MKTVIKGKEWYNYLQDKYIRKMKYMELYKGTYKHTQIFKIGEYYFTFGIKAGYKNLASLKKLL